MNQCKFVKFVAGKVGVIRGNEDSPRRGRAAQLHEDRADCFDTLSTSMREMAQYPAEFEQMLVHTGQHYDASMSQVFFDELELPKPDVHLEVGSGSHAAQVMLRFESVLLDYKPDRVIMPGDVNSMMACALGRQDDRGLAASQ